ncbi:hypothetical protein [Kitasatospora acidiphila]|uniref:hypothetical protein n=1 Tax=Kitasatospora acidiphila TaxID=2567942 RepID=UPI0015F0293E|nr:hypothetical protein [Kitasatospora acidiphila]
MPTPVPSTPGTATTPTSTPSPRPSGGAPISTASLLPARHEHFPYPLLIAAVLVAAGIAAAVLTAWNRKRRLRKPVLTYGQVSEPVAAENTGISTTAPEDPWD